MKKILKSLSLSFAALTLLMGVVMVTTTGCPTKPTNETNPTTVDNSIVTIGERTATSVKVTVKLKASPEYSYYSIAGSFTANADGKTFDYDGGWGGGASFATNTPGNADDDGNLTFIIYANYDGANTFKIQPRGWTSDDFSGTAAWYGEEPTFQITNLSKDILYTTAAPQKATVDITFTLSLDTTASPHPFDYNGNGTAGEIGDFVLAGTPAIPFAGHPGSGADPLSVSGAFSNTVAYTKDATLFTVTIPSGTELGLDISVYGTNENIETTLASSKVGAKCILNNQAAASVNVVVGTNDAGFGKLSSTVTGDVTLSTLTLVDNGITAGNPGAISFDAASYVAVAANATVIVMLTDPDVTATSVTVSINGTDKTLHQATNGVFTNTVTVGKTGADYNSTTNFTLTVSYSDADPATTITKTAAVAVIAPEDKIDGLVSAGYTDLGASKNAVFSSIAVDSDGSNLYVALTYASADSANVFLMIDVTNKTGGFTTTPMGDLLTGWGSGANPANSAGIDFDWIKWGNGINGTDCFAWGSEKAYEANALIDAGDTNAPATYAVAGTVVEVGIPYANLGKGGASAGNVVNVYLIQGDLGGSIADVFPTAATTTDISAKSADYTLE